MEIKRYRKHARALYRLFSWGLSALSGVKPLFRLALRILTGRSRHIRGHVLPVNRSLGEAAQTALSRDVLAGLIARSTAVGAMNECLCRAVGGCTDYPADLGCLLLGDAVRELHPGLGREVSRQEALNRVDRALALNLTPMIIHFKSDAVLWSLDHSRMLTICFCCPCHCLIREAVGSRSAPSANLTGLPGVTVALQPDKCTGCGRCRAACFLGALHMEQGKPAIDETRCVACGRCAMACPHGALTVKARCAVDAAPVAREYEQRTKQGRVFF